MSKAKRTPAPMAAGLTFDRFVLSIRGIDAELDRPGLTCRQHHLTLRKWLILDYNRLDIQRSGPDGKEHLADLLCPVHDQPQEHEE